MQTPKKSTKISAQNNFIKDLTSFSITKVYSIQHTKNNSQKNQLLLLIQQIILSIGLITSSNSIHSIRVTIINICIHIVKTQILLQVIEDITFLKISHLAPKAIALRPLLASLWLFSTFSSSFSILYAHDSQGMNLKNPLGILIQLSSIL